MNNMKLSENGVRLIKKHEGFRREAYLCPADIPTIGYGNTYYSDGTMVTLGDEPLSDEEAELLLANIVRKFEDGVTRYVTSKLTSNQFDALVSFSYNVGLGAFKSSTLLKRVNNNPNDSDIANQFMRWNKGNGKVLNGLTKRRKSESELYFKN